MITVIIPTYNEAGNIVPLLHELHGLLPEARLLVVDDSSPDGTGDIVGALAAEKEHVELLSRSEKSGLGNAYRAAFAHVLKDGLTKIIVMMDADFSHDPAYVPELIAALDDAHVAIGSRYVAGGHTTGWEKWRLALSSMGNLYARTVTRHPVRDQTAGFYAISADMLRQVDPRLLDASGYAFQIELKYRLHKAGARFAEVPIHFKQRREGESKLSGHIISEGLIAPWKMIWKQ